MMNPWMIVPLKSLRDGKTRLAPQLAAAQRELLNRRLLTQVLHAAAQFPGASRTLVVSGCGDALALAREHGTEVLPEHGADGLNPAVEEARAHVQRLQPSSVLIVAGDLPLIDSDALRKVVAESRAGTGIVVATDRQRTGTNALFVPAGAPFDVKFGLDSCQLHLQEARRRGLDATVLHDPRIAFDVDTMPDYREYLDSLASESALPQWGTTQNSLLSQ